MSRFDIAEAWFLYLYQYNCGMDCKNYKRLCRMMEWFEPRESLFDYNSLSDEGKQVYDTIIERKMN